MKIEVGKKYVDRSGYVREIHSCTFATHCGKRYDENGKAADSSDDLIEEFVEPLIRYTGEYITRSGERVSIIHCFQSIAVGYFISSEVNPTVWRFRRKDGAFLSDERFVANNPKFDIVKRAT